MNPSTQTQGQLQTIFLGYQSSGKTTLLASLVLASRLERGGKALRVSTVAGSSDNPRLHERMAELERREPVKKTEANELLEYELAVSLASGPSIVVRTLDYPGELAAGEQSSPQWQQFCAYVAGSHCLFLCFDGARARPNMNDAIDRLLVGGQNSTIWPALERFVQDRPGFPVYVVVTKAESMAYHSTGERRLGDADAIAREIDRLNQNDSEARTRFAELFGREANERLSRYGVKKVRYVAALGADAAHLDFPSQRAMTTGDFGTIIRDFNTWTPLGFEAALVPALTRALRVASKRRPIDWVRRIGPPTWKPAAAATVLSLAILGVVAHDRGKVSELEALVAVHEQSGHDAQFVLDHAKSLRRPLYPTLYFRRTLLGPLNLEAPRRLDEIIEIFSEKVLGARLEKLTFATRDFEDRQRAKAFDFSQSTEKFERDVHRWQTLLEDIRVYRAQSPDLARRQQLQATLLEPAGRAFAEYCVATVGQLWRTAADVPELAMETVVRVVGHVAERMDQLEQDDQLASVSHGLRPAFDEAVRTGKCAFAGASYRRHARTPGGDDGERMTRAVAFCQACQGLPEEQQACANMQAQADRWDYAEALDIYKSYPKSRHTLPGPQLAERFARYLTHVADRRKFDPNVRSRLHDEAVEFMGWYEDLEASYPLTSITLKIDDSGDFLRTRVEERTRSRGWSKETYFETVYLPPHGTVVLEIGDDRYTFDYSGRSATVAVATRIRWRPGLPIRIQLVNFDSGRTLKFEQRGHYSLFMLARKGVSSPEATIKFSGIKLPQRRPTKLSRPRHQPDPPRKPRRKRTKR